MSLRGECGRKQVGGCEPLQGESCGVWLRNTVQFAGRRLRVQGPLHMLPSLLYYYSHSCWKQQGHFGKIVEFCISSFCLMPFNSLNSLRNALLFQHSWLEPGVVFGRVTDLPSLSSSLALTLALLPQQVIAFLLFSPSRDLSRFPP